MKNDHRGSQWRQWDLHFHTPSSPKHDYKNGSVSNEQLVETLIAEGISGVVITDHHIIDVARIRRLQELATNRLVVFPGIELRSELGGREHVHYIGIFPEDSDLDDLWSKIQGSLEITPRDVANKGDNRVYVPFADGATLFHKLGGIVSVHAGRKTNSFENITNVDEFKQAVKEDLIREHIDILEIGSKKDIEGYQKKVFPDLKCTLPLVIGSDNHDVHSYQRKSPCWIKADVTFEGLRHVLHEPESRVFLGDMPPQLERVRSNRTKYIRSISLKKLPDSTLKENWFSGKTEFTHGLAAIIGSKGSGKSALADILGLLGDSPHGNSFSFLNPEKFRQAKSNKARHFEAKICWESDGVAQRNLDEVVDEASPESVKYIPQAYLETVCNELNTGAGNGFSRELKSVIFSHISEEDRLGYDNLDALLNYRTEETDNAISLLRNDLRAVIDEVVSLEERLKPPHRKSLESHLAMKERELTAHDAAKPTEILKPESDPETTEVNAKIEKQITMLAKEIDDLDQEIASLNQDRLRQTRKVAAADRLLSRVDNLETQVKAFHNESIGDCAELNIDPDSVARVKISKDLITRAKDSSAKTLERITLALDSTNATGPVAKKKNKETETQGLHDKLGEPQQKYQRYLTELETWKERRVEIVGSSTTSGTLEYYKQQIDLLSTVPESLRQANDRCHDAAVSIYRKINSLAADYRNVYQPVQKFIQEHSLAKDHFELKFETSILSVGFPEGLLELVNQGRRGSFYGDEEGLSRASQLVREANFSTEQGIVAFLEQVEKHLRYDMRQSPPEEISVDSQLKKTAAPNALYEYLYSLGYLEPHYTLQWAGKEIEQLSPGERGTLLLVFYLLIDRSDIPLVIDQPEENLDNETVYKILVPSIMEAKNRRQIILVTHNPNLAVVCDADQIIHASLDKDNGNRVTYTTGALENPLINRKVVDVLEGTRPAFDNREKKYHKSYQYGPRIGSDESNFHNR